MSDVQELDADELHLHSGDTTAREYVNGSKLDDNFGTVRARMNQIVVALDAITRPDNTLQDSLIRVRNLHPEVFAKFGRGSNVVNIYQSIGGGSGGGSDSSSGINVKDSLYNARGDGASHSLTAGEATAYNAQFSSVGAQGAFEIQAGDQRDYAAIQCALWTAATTGESVYIPPGTYRINRPLTLQWTATPITGQPDVPLVCRIHGAGRSSVLKGYGIVAGRAVLELLGESNGNAVNCEVSHLQVEEDATCHKYSYCIRAGDAYCGVSLHRVICKGANALALRVGSSVNYAQICFSATQSQFWSNWDRRWGPDDALMDVYALNPESLGSYWDLAKFDSCFFWGQVDCRAFNLKFESCMFINQVERAASFCCTVYLGTATWDNCYFEDYLVGIATNTATATVPITNITVRNCHFSTANNSGTPANVQACIQCARFNEEHGPVLIENCRFGSTATYSNIDLYGPITVDVRGCCRPFLPGINTAPSITTAGDVRLIKRNPNGEQPYDLIQYIKVRITCEIFMGASIFIEDVAGAPALTMRNPNTGATSAAVIAAESDDSSARLISYHGAHASLPYWAIVMSSEPGGPVALAPGGLPRLIADETWVRASKSVNAGYGYGAENVNAGAAAVAFYYATNGADFAVFQIYGTGHSLAGQAFLGTSTNKKMNFGANGLFEMSIDPADRRVRVREYGVMGGHWYIQTTTQQAANTVGDIGLTFGGLGNLTIPANQLQVGSIVDLDAIITEAAAVPVTYTHRFYAGATVIGSRTGVFGGVSAAAPRALRMRGVVKTLGVTGTLDWVIYDEGVAVAFGTATIDTTGTLLFYLSTQPDAADVGNVVTCPQATFAVVL
jgi:hypothetical protein